MAEKIVQPLMDLTIDPPLSQALREPRHKKKMERIMMRNYAKVIEVERMRIADELKNRTKLDCPDSRFYLAFSVLKDTLIFKKAVSNETNTLRMKKAPIGPLYPPTV